MPSHNPECTHGYSHDYSACRDSRGTALKMLEDPIEVPQASNPVLTNDQLTPADREALSRALAGLTPVSVRDLAGADHDPHRDPDGDADAAQRAGDQF